MTPVALLLGTLLFAQADGGAAAPAQLEPHTVAQNVAPPEVRLGEPFTRTLTIAHPADQRWELRAPPSSEGPLETLDLQRARKDGPRVATTTFTLQQSAFELGDVALPPLSFDVATEDGERQWTSEASTVKVVSALPDDAEQKGAGFYDIRPPEKVPVRSWTPLVVLAGLIAAALLAWLAYRWWKRRELRKAAAPPPPLLPLGVRTRQALDALAAEALPAKGQIKPFYSRLSDIVRAYLGERYGVEALECTSSELLDRLGQVQDEALAAQPLAAFLFEADLVKFARATRTPDECQQALQFGYRLLDATDRSAP